MPDTRRLLVVVNKSAGSTDDDVARAALAELRSGAEVTVAETADEDDLVEAVGARDGRGVVVVGGDGSVHATVRALARVGGLDPGEPVGIIPRGTANILARDLGLPLDPAGSAAVVLSGRPRPLDLLRDGAGGVVINAVHAGLGARAYAEATRFKRRLGPAAFPLGAVVAGARNAGWDLRVEADGRVLADEGAGGRGVLMVAVCNGPTVGGGTVLAPGAELDDGLAEVVVCTATGPFARVGFALALAAGRHVRRCDVRVVRAREVTFSGPRVELEADGEMQEPTTARTWRVQHHAWSVIVPR